MSKEAMKLALEAINNLITSSHATDPQHWRDARQDAVTALDAIDKALAEQPAQHKPFTHYRHYDNGLQDWADEKTIPLYTSPPASKPWVGLTDEEIEKGRDQTFSINNPYCPCDSKTMRKAVRWAEAKLKEKNT